LLTAKDRKEFVNSEANSKGKVTMYHDGDCPLCKFEVKTMQKLDTANAIHWVDITQDKAALEKAGISYKKAMARVHVQDENQNMLTGVAGFIEVWKSLPYYRWLAAIITHVPLLLPISEFFYSGFAKYRLPLTGKKQLD
jgi:predicted DCC family thiol-disulfide oxidoreductase YuxK